MQGRVIPSSESTWSKPSRCVRCSEPLFGHDQQGVHVASASEREPGHPWLRSWAPPEMCPMCEHFVPANRSGGKNYMENHLRDHFHQSLVQGILIRARWPHTSLIERCRKAEELRSSRACPEICPNEFLGEGWFTDAFECVHWKQPDETKFRTQRWEYWNIESAEFNPERAITEDSPVSHRCQSQYFNLAKVGGPILGNPLENWDLPMIPNPSSPDYTDEVPQHFRECLQVVRDAVRPRSKEVPRRTSRPRGFTAGEDCRSRRCF